MTEKKFYDEIETLQDFIGFYCTESKHGKKEKKELTCKHQNFERHINIELCEECFYHLKYSVERLQNCPHDSKPRCRKCPNPCYEKREWKDLAKIMRYNGVKRAFKKISEALFS